MVRLWEILPNAEEVELVGMTEVEETALIFNPELAIPILGVDLVTRFWNKYGERIQKYVVEQSIKEVQRAKDFVVDQLPHKAAGERPLIRGDAFSTWKRRKNSNSRGEMQRRRQERENDPQRAEEEVDEKLDEIENPPPPESKVAIPEMGKWTSYPSGSMCVDLGTMELNPKKATFIDDASITGMWTSMRNMYQWLGGSITDSRQFQILTEAAITMDNNDHLSAAMGNDGQAVRHHMYPNPTYGATYRNCSFNSAFTLMETLQNLPVDESGYAAVVFDWPIPDGSVYTDTFYQTNSAHLMVGLRNQYIELHLKNMSGSAHTFDNLSEQVPKDSPCKITVRVIQANKDILVPVDADNSIDNIFNSEFGVGFKQSYDVSRSDDPLKPVASTTQNYQIHLGENGSFSRDWEVISKKEFCLCPGQEGTLKIGLPKTQLLSWKYLLSAKKGTLVSGTVGTNGIWRMKSPYIKKGEQHVMLEFHGGVGVGTSTTFESANIKPTSLACLWTHSYEYCYISSAVSNEVIKTVHNAKTAYTTYTDDVNVVVAQT